uniref:Endonuclease/exonuclease/phosphatase domain-containing protein n=1 Tax=Aplanochytrium stocchinoi TaxID=215587 RepID=A0A7S3PP42_9STRA
MNGTSGEEINSTTKEDCGERFASNDDDEPEAISLSGIFSQLAVGLTKKIKEGVQSYFGGGLTTKYDDYWPNDDLDSELEAENKKSYKNNSIHIPSYDHSQASEYIEKLKREQNQGTCFSVMSFNILADRYVRNPRHSNLYAHCDPKCLPWSYRFNKIMNHLGEVDADIVCLQEVDKDVYETFEPLLHNRGYEGVLQLGNPKKKGEGKDIPGLATFFRRSIFEKNWVIASYRASILGLTIKKGHEKGRVLALLNCHLEGAPWKHKERKDQLNAAIRKLKKADFSYSLLCGDFNGSLEDNSLALNTAIKHGYRSVYLNHPSRDISCLISPREVDPKNPNIYMVDNILHGSSLTPIAVMNVMNSSWNRKKVIKRGLPSLHWPSDHLSVGAILSFSKSSNLRTGVVANPEPKTFTNLEEERKKARSELENALSNKELKIWNKFEMAEDEQKCLNRLSPGTIEVVKKRSQAKQNFLDSLSAEKQKIIKSYAIAKKKSKAKKGQNKSKGLKKVNKQKHKAY